MDLVVRIRRHTISVTRRFDAGVRQPSPLRSSWGIIELHFSLALLSVSMIVEEYFHGLATVLEIDIAMPWKILWHHGLLWSGISNSAAESMIHNTKRRGFMS